VLIPLAVWILLAAVSPGSIGAAFAEDDVEPPPGRFRHLAVEDGLSHGSVYALLQDSDGFVWLGTEDGLVVGMPADAVLAVAIEVQQHAVE